MKIIGIDPGLRCTGFGIIESSNNKLEVVDFGIIKTNSKDSLSKRLKTIYIDVKEIIESYKPSIMSIEEVFYGKNVKSALLLGQARGAAMLSVASNKITIFEYSAKKIKQSVTGNGNADKNQVKFMVGSILNIKNLDIPLDASDALAIALCHNQQLKVNEL